MEDERMLGTLRDCTGVLGVLDLEPLVPKRCREHIPPDHGRLRHGGFIYLSQPLPGANGVRLRGDLTFEAVTDEETGAMGTVAAIERGYRADAGLVP